MIITCPACATQFRVPDGALGSNGRKLRCSSCRHVWFQEPIAPPLEDTPLEDTAGTEAAAPTPAPSPAPLEEPAAATAVEAAPIIPEPPVAEAETPQSPPPPAEESPASTVSESEAALTETEEQTAPDAPAEEASPESEADSTSEPPAAESEEPVPAAPAKVGTTGWEPGAVMPRNVKPEPTPQSPQTPRGSLRLVGKEAGETPATAPSAPVAGPKAAKPNTPAFDVTRVVTPDSAPAEAEAPPRRKRRSGLILVLLLLVAVGAGAYFERNQVMRFVPQTAQFYRMVGLLGAPSAQGLQLLDVAFRVEEVGGTPSLIVSGKVMNVGRDYHLIPELHVMLLNEAGDATETWALRTTAEGLAPGAVTVFEAVYPDPPRTGQDENFGLVFADLI